MLLQSAEILRWRIGRRVGMSVAGAVDHSKLTVASVGAVAAAACLMNVAAFVLPQHLSFDFAKPRTCAVSPVLLPQLFGGASDQTFSVSRPSSFSIGPVALVSARLCVTPRESPAASRHYAATQSFSLLGLHLSKDVTVATTSYPQLVPAAAMTAHLAGLPLLTPAVFELQQDDGVYDYELRVGQQAAPCSRTGRQVRCNLQPLHLSYGTRYRLQLVRRLHGHEAGLATSTTVTTITAAAITHSTVSAGSTVYNIPTKFILTTNKPISKLASAELSYDLAGKSVAVPIRTQYSGKSITVLLNSPLPRQKHFVLRIGQIQATDQSQLERPFVLKFSTSGGPKVTGGNLAGYGVSRQPTIQINFDQPLDPHQSIEKYVKLAANGSNVPLSYSISGRQLTLRPQTGLHTCARLTVSTNSSVTSRYGIRGNSTWSFHSRVVCYTTFSIGKSVKGRSIAGYRFGSGSNVVLYIGAIHGDEQNSTHLLDRWIDALDADPDRIPAGRTVEVIPSTNPDGYAADSRLNAHGVDLNRNFPTGNWKKMVSEPGSNGKKTAAGGPHSLSEPESQDLANYTVAKHPRLVLTYHCQAGLVEPNDAADSDALGLAYVATAHYRDIPTYAIGDTFDYDTTGAYEDWLKQKYNIPVLVVEMSTCYSDEYTRNITAMWHMAEISR